MYGYIYKTTNNINNKIYIGQHKATATRKSYKGSGKMLARAFKKYGKENFSIEILEWCETSDELDNREVYWIKYYDSQDPTIGYNIANGGKENFFTGCKHTDEAKEKMRQAHLGKTFSESHCKAISESKKGSKYPEESNKKRAETLKALYANGRPNFHPNKGKKFSEEIKAKMSAAHKGKKYSEEHRIKMANAHKGLKYNKTK